MLIIMPALSAVEMLIRWEVIVLIMIIYLIKLVKDSDIFPKFRL
jgi:hypothetical protein